MNSKEPVIQVGSGSCLGQIYQSHTNPISESFPKKPESPKNRSVPRIRNVPESRILRNRIRPSLLLTTPARPILMSS